MATLRPDPAPPDGDPRADDWYRRSFDALYLELYAHRDEREAGELVSAIARSGRKGPVLEVACGAGRFLAALTAEGESTAGLDLSPELLGRARRRLGPDARLVRGDMRRLPFATGRFGLVLFLFTSFGYFAREEDDREALREAARVLTRGGHLLLDLFNAAVTLRRLEPQTRRVVGERPVTETRWVDPDGPFLRKRIEVESGGKVERREERVRIYSPADLAGLAGSVGLRVVEFWGDYLGSRFAEETSERCLLWARRETG